MSDEYIFDEDGDYGMGDAQQSSDGYSLSQPSNNNNTGGGGASASASSGKSKFFSLNGEEVVEKYIEPLARKVATPLCLSVPTAIFLLGANGWSEEKTITAYFEDEARACKKAGCKPCPSGDAAIAQNRKEKTYDCKVCFDSEDETQPGVSLSCGHGVCMECWRGFLDVQLSGKGDMSWFATCPDFQCKLPAAPAFELITTAPSKVDEDAAASDDEERKVPSYKSRLEERLAKLYVTNNSHMFAHCSSPTCDRFLYCGPSRTTLPERSVNNVVKCTCTQQTCVRCELPNHLPATCDNMKGWDSKEQADSANANWILANTKQCPNPKCRKAIEKNQGCNHMSCSQCRYEFCWVCMGDWHKHGSSGYSCNKRVDDPTRDSAANELERYIHYYTRYRNHEKSKSLDGAILNKARVKAEMMLRAGTAKLHDTDFWEKTALTLSAARRTLAFSYVYAFYLPTKTEHEKGVKELFEFQQGQLEHATEMLSEFVTATVSEVKPDEIVARMTVTQQMLKNLEAGCMM